MYTEEQKKELKKIDDRLDEQILKIFEFDKLDVISLTKEDFKFKMCMVKMSMTAAQAEGMMLTMARHGF